MKTLTKYLNEKLIIFPSQVDEKLVINQWFDEKLIINKNYNDPHTCAPKSFNELRWITEDRYKRFGRGTKNNPIDFNDVDVSNINSFFDENNSMGIFQRATFEYIDVSYWNVSNVKDMHNMFYNCKQLKSIGDLSNWNVSNVDSMYAMFYGCAQLTSVGDLSDWNVSNVKNMFAMFCDCINLKSVGYLSNWNVSKVETMMSMFYACKQLTSVGDLSNWNISKVKDISYMFNKSGITNIPKWYKE